jgi:hypothetical protein
VTPSPYNHRAQPKDILLSSCVRQQQLSIIFHVPLSYPEKFLDPPGPVEIYPRSHVDRRSPIVIKDQQVDFPDKGKMYISNDDV